MGKRIRYKKSKKEEEKKETQKNVENKTTFVLDVQSATVSNNSKLGR